MKRGRNQRRRQGVNINRALDSNGPDVRIRGTANQIYDKYQSLARDASSAGDSVKAESYLQHAEHYFRMIKSIQAQNGTPNQQANNNNAPSNNGDGASSDNADGGGTLESAQNGQDQNADAKSDNLNNTDGKGRNPRRRRPRADSKSSNDKSEDPDSDSKGLEVESAEPTEESTEASGDSDEKSKKPARRPRRKKAETAADAV